MVLHRNVTPAGSSSYSMENGPLYGRSIYRRKSRTRVEEVIVKIPPVYDPPRGVSYIPISIKIYRTAMAIMINSSWLYLSLISSPSFLSV